MQEELMMVMGVNSSSGADSRTIQKSYDAGNVGDTIVRGSYASSTAGSGAKARAGVTIMH